MNGLLTPIVILVESATKSEAWRGLRDSLPVMLGFIPFGASRQPRSD